MYLKLKVYKYRRKANELDSPYSEEKKERKKTLKNSSLFGKSERTNCLKFRNEKASGGRDI